MLPPWRPVIHPRVRYRRLIDSTHCHSSPATTPPTLDSTFPRQSLPVPSSAGSLLNTGTPPPGITHDPDALVWTAATPHFGVEIAAAAACFPAGAADAPGAAPIVTAAPSRTADRAEM